MFDSLLQSLIGWFSLPANGLSTVFVVSFVSATLLPIGSEPAVFGYVKLNPDQYWVVVAVATVGNTLGGMADYWVGRGAKYAIAKDGQARYFKWFERLGSKWLSSWTSCKPPCPSTLSFSSQYVNFTSPGKSSLAST